MLFYSLLIVMFLKSKALQALAHIEMRITTNGEVISATIIKLLEEVGLYKIISHLKHVCFVDSLNLL